MTLPVITTRHTIPYNQSYARTEGAHPNSITPCARTEGVQSCTAPPFPPSPSHPYNLQPMPHCSTCAVIQATPRALVNAIYDPGSGSMLEYKQLLKKDPQTWNYSMANKIGRLAQGIGNRIKGTNTIKFIKKQEIPSHKTVTYARIVADYRPHKSEPF